MNTKAFLFTAILIPTNLWAATLAEVQKDADRVVAKIDVVGDQLTERQLGSVQTKLTEILTLLKEPGTANEFNCFPSQSVAGSFYIAKWSDLQTKFGNYYTSQANCKQALQQMNQNMLCYESESQVPKAFIANILHDPGYYVIGNMYDNLASCQDAFAKKNGTLICMQSASKAGKWFIGDLLNDPSSNSVSGYYDSYAACLSVLH